MAYELLRDFLNRQIMPVLCGNFQFTIEHSLTSAPNIFTMGHSIDNWFNGLQKAFETVV